MPRRWSCPSRTLWILTSLISLAAAACRSTPGAGAGPVAAQEALPASAFFRNQPTQIALSPDGERIAGVLGHANDRIVFVKPVRESGIRAIAKLNQRGGDVRVLGWSGNDTVVVGFDDDRGPFADAPGRVAKGGRLYLRMVTLRIARWQQPTPTPGWPLAMRPDDPVSVLDWLPDDSDHILVNRWESEERGASVQRADVESGFQTTVVPAQLGMRRWFADARGDVRAGRGYDPEAATELDYARRSDEDAFGPLADVGEVLASELEFAGFAPDPNTLYVYARGESGHVGLFEYDLEQRRRTRLVHADPEVDVGALVFSPASGRLWAIEVEHQRPELYFVDPEGRREYASIDAVFPGCTNRIVSASRDGSTAIVRVSGDTRPPAYYVYDRAKRQMALLYDSLPELAGATLAPMRAVSFTARDGLEIPAYLSLPPGADPSNLPVVVILHDGPTDRVHWGFDATVQFLVSRGFAVFQPNFRGSSGYGLEFERRGYREWGGAMQDDVIDGVHWLVAQGIADPDRIGVFGRGYGGYAALLALATDPELFRAGAAWGAVTDRTALLESPEDYGSPELNHPTAGATPADREALAARSPARLADRIRAPVFIAHGGVDRVVAVSQLRAMEDALEAAGDEFESEEYRDQGHELSDEQDRIDFHERLARFFERNLSPRVPL